jgi:hypothetical protein
MEESVTMEISNQAQLPSNQLAQLLGRSPRKLLLWKPTKQQPAAEPCPIEISKQLFNIIESQSNADLLACQTRDKVLAYFPLFGEGSLFEGVNVCILIQIDAGECKVITCKLVTLFRQGNIIYLTN